MADDALIAAGPQEEEGDGPEDPVHDHLGDEEGGRRGDEGGGQTEAFAVAVDQPGRLPASAVAVLDVQLEDASRLARTFGNPLGPHLADGD